MVFTSSSVKVYGDSARTAPTEQQNDPPLWTPTFLAFPLLRKSSCPHGTPLIYRTGYIFSLEQSPDAADDFAAAS